MTALAIPTPRQAIAANSPIHPEWFRFLRELARRVTLDEIQEFTAATLPAASVTWLHRLVWVYDAGSPETLQACVRTGAGGYEWVIVLQASA